MIISSQEEFNTFIEKLPIAIACFDEERRYFAVNEACVEINGVPAEETIGKTVAEVLPDLEEKLAPIFDTVYLQKRQVKDTLIEGKTPASQDLRFWHASYQPLALDNGKQGLLVTAEEITKQIFATQSAESNKRLLSDVLNSLFTFVGLLDADGVLLDANKAPLEAAGIDISKVQGKYFWDCFWWTYSDTTVARIKQAVENVQAGESVRFDVDLRAADGFLTIDFMMEGLRNSDGKLTHIIPSAIDISKRKKAEEKLLQSQSRFETVINRTVDGLVACDHEGRVQFVNHRFEELVRSPVETGEALIFDYIDDEAVLDRLGKLMKRVDIDGIHAAVKNTSSSIEQDLCILKPSLNPVEIAFSPLLDGTEVLFLATVSDVSALYEANKALETALNEKTLLLNEVHHRVKNNLQVMSSLLNLQANSAGTDETTKNALLDSQRRLKSMALIHQLLYEKEDFTFTDIQQFTSRLLDLLQDSMVNGKDITIQKVFASKSIMLNINQVVSFGFLVTELVTNAYKHAFKDLKTDEKIIRVCISKLANNIEVIISDNGKGYDEAEAKQKASLGKDLIYIFSRQLKADLTTTIRNGVTHTLNFQNQPK